MGFFYTTNAIAEQGCDLAHGAKIFQKCAVCHSTTEDGAHSTGPNLRGMLGGPVGKVEGFKFTRQLRKSEETWTAEHLDEFLESPMEMYPRTSMAFAGLKNAEARTAVVCYISANLPR